MAVKDGCVLVEGAKSKLSTRIPPMVSVDVKDGNVLVTRSAESNQARAMHGLARSLINNMMLGVTQGYKKELQIVGVGYKAVLSGSKLTLSLGFSHPVVYEVPQGIKMTIADSTKIMIEGDMDAGAWSCGMVAGLIHDIPTCKELIDRIMREADALIRGRLEGMLA